MMQQQKVKETSIRKAAPNATSKTTVHAPRQAHREATRIKEVHDPNAPTLVPCSLRGPDGQDRPGWELWVGDILFGRADTKESLLQYYARIHEPMPSGHWRENSWPSSPRVARRPRREHHYDDYTDDVNLENESAGRWD